MTNGEKIQQMFPGKCPHIGFNENFGRIWLMQNGEDFANFTLKWWNAEYKEPITKNCESCRYYGLHHEVCKYCYECSLWTQGEPTTKNDLGVDCISRAEAIKCLECDFDITGKENMKTVVNYINSAHDKIVNLPRVKQEPKTGHWIVHPKGIYAHLVCDKCLSSAPYDCKTNYCPNCGAKMEEE